jgi:SAM-dependent methyltransferase
MPPLAQPVGCGPGALRSPVDTPTGPEGIVADDGPNYDWTETKGRYWVAEQARYDRMLAPFGEAVIAAVDPVPGGRLIDVGCGTGAFTVQVAERLVPGGEVVGLDVSPPMLAAARSRPAPADGTEVRFVEADVERGVPVADVDVAVSRFGVMFFTDPVAGFTSIAGALRPGGRVAFACWQALDRQSFRRIAIDVLTRYTGVGIAPPPDGPGPYGLADPDRVSAVLGAAGLDDVRLEEVERGVWLGSDPADAIDAMATSESLSAWTGRLDEGDRARAWAEVRDRLAAVAGDGEVVMPGRVWVVTARRP